MPQSRAILFFATLFLVLACSSLPLSRGPAASNATTVPPTAALTPTDAPTLLPTESVTQIPLHVGRGFRGSWFEIYFTDPTNPASDQSTGGVDTALIAAIDQARLSIHAAVYSLSLGGVRDALIRAHRRGIDVRLVTESDNLESDALQRIKEAGIPILGDRLQGSMHNKFMVVDRSDVWTGSMNFTVSGVYQDNNVLVHIMSSDVAANYEAEFSEMFEADRFGPGPGRAVQNPRLQIGGAIVETYFSPDDDVERQLTNLLDTAQESLYFLAYSLTSNPIGDAIARARAAGLSVQGVLDEDQGVSNLGTELPTLRAAGVDVRLDGNAGQMHEKVLIIDGEVVVVGSYNFSRNASETNDENVLVIHNRPIAELFMGEFQRMYDRATP